MSPAGSPHAHAHHHAHEGDEGHGLLDLLDLDAAVLHDYWSTALDLVSGHAAGATRVVDLGAGTGTGALGLAERLPAAEVLAVDVDAESLARLRAAADARGLAARVRTLEADLDARLPDLGVVDLTWASMSLHHLADPARLLRELRSTTREGGLIAVAEFPEPQRYLPDDLASLEDRVVAAYQRERAEDMPTLGTAWAPRLVEAG